MSSAQTTPPSPTATDSLPSKAETPLVVMVQGTCFWLTKDSLTCYSTVFKAMFSDGKDIGSAEEGSNHMPLVLEGIKHDDFEPLIRWLRFGSNPPQDHDYTLRDLLGMLFLADQWDMKETEKFCFQGLAQIAGDPFFMLKLVAGYWRWDRLRALVEEAVKLPSPDWKFDNLSIYEPIMKLKIRLNEVVRQIVQIPDYIPKMDSCVDHHMCTIKWRNDWRHYIMEPVLRADLPQPLNQCYAVMVANSPKPNACRKEALRRLRENNEFDFEEDLYHDTVNKIRSQFD
ncbi:hypothetical protein BJ165DRAFT_1408551 [Panaeolus papilionaceus]|nr:hypothetical protein BJ165DRAFT_1408551 [Panaeolus papilionaceus]